MGENKASYLTKSYVEKIPASDQKDVHELKTGVGNAAGGALQNPLGKFVCCVLASLTAHMWLLIFLSFRLVTPRMISPSLLLDGKHVRSICISKHFHGRPPCNTTTWAAEHAIFLDQALP